MSHETPPTELTSEAWEAGLVELVEKEGFYRRLGDKHSALFSHRGKTLVVTFENLDHVFSNAQDRLPWGYSFAQTKGWSVLGLMAHEWSWYRDEHVLDFFDELRDQGFFEQFDRVIFYGASMGAYAACAFSSAAPGADVIAISPQATLDRDIASWETRYRKAWRRNFSNRYGYAPEQLKTARSVLLFFDPAAPLDAMHAALFQGDNIERIRCRFMGHRIMSLWSSMGVLKNIVEAAMAEGADRTEIYQLMRARHDTPRYQKELLERLVASGRNDLIVRLCASVIARRKAPHFRGALRIAQRHLRLKDGK